MHPAFVSRNGATPVPIWFVTTDNYAQVREGLSDAARRFAETAMFEPKAGQSLLLPASDGALSGVLFGLEGADKPEKDRFLPGRLPGLLPAGPYRFANAPHDTRLAALAFALGSYKFTRYRKADPSGAQLEVPEGVEGADSAHRRRCRARARSDQHAGERSWARRVGAGRARPRVAAWREHSGDRRRGIAQAQLSADPCGRPRCRARSAPDRSHLGRSGCAEGHAGRQGRVLRYRRARHQAGLRDADHEEGHGRRGLRARRRAHDHGRKAEAAAARADPGGRECDRGRCLPPARHLQVAQGDHGRDRQYRCRRPAGARRCARARRRGDTRADRRHGDPDGRRKGGARSRIGAVLYRTTTRSRPTSPAMRGPRTIRCGACRFGSPTSRCSIPRPPTSTMSAAASRARSRRRCSSAAS